MEKENKEMDLFDLFEKIGSKCKEWCCEFGNAMLWLIRFKLKNWLVLSVFTIVGFVLAYYSYIPENRIKYAEFRIQVNGTNSFAVHDIVKVLNQKVDFDGGNQLLAQTLGLDQKIVAPVKKIEPFYVIDLNKNKTPDFVDYNVAFEEDTLSHRIPYFLNIRMEVKGLSDYDVIQKEIVEYLKEDPYLKAEGKERIRVIKDQITVLDDEIAALKNLRDKELLNNKISLDFKKSSFIVESSSYSDKIVELEKDKSVLYENLSLQYDVVTNYSNVLVYNKRTNLFIFVSRMLPVILLGFLLALLITYRKEIKKALK